jgi:hypothetical protein
MKKSRVGQFTFVLFILRGDLLKVDSCTHTVKKVFHFPGPSRDVTNQILPGRE